MKIQSIKLITLATLLTVALSAKASERWETLRAINWVENPTNQTHAGRFGELGPYQFRAETWRMHSDKPFSLAIQRAAADEVAIKHYEWIKAMFEKAGVEPSTFNIAMAWNCGLGAVLKGRIPEASYDYARRVTNLVQAQERSSHPVAAVRKDASPAGNDIILDDNDATVRFHVFNDGPRFVLASS